MKRPTNEGKDWSALDIEDLTDAARLGESVESIADFLCRTEEEIIAKATELGVKFSS